MQNLTDLSTIRALCEKYGFALSKGFGQNFLVNKGVPVKICDASGIDETTNVIEVGPGFGTLTQQLAARAKKVVAVEVDSRLFPVLEETLAGTGVQVVEGDILKVDLHRLIDEQFGGGPVSVCANLPYYITSPIVMRLLEERLPLESITVMVQKEAADRIIATPGTRGAGAISYAVHYWSTPKLCFTVKPGSFYPPPTVTSAVIRLAPHEKPALAGQPQREQRLFKLVRASFGQRRKTLANAASAGLGLPKAQLNEALQAANLATNLRPEQLTLEDYIRLEAALWPEAEA